MKIFVTRAGLDATTKKEGRRGELTFCLERNFILSSPLTSPKGFFVRACANNKIMRALRLRIKQFERCKTHSSWLIYPCDSSRAVFENIEYYRILSKLSINLTEYSLKLLNSLLNHSVVKCESIIID